MSCVKNYQESCLARGVRHCGYHVCFLGTIAAGKSTWSRALQDVIIENEGRCEGLWEPVEDNPLLPLYYKDPNRFAFSMQINMLNKRYEQQMLAQDLALAGISSVQDSSMFGDSCFVQMLHEDGIMCDEEVNVYSELFANMCRNVMYPSLVVHLDCDPNVAKQRVLSRGRECESGIPVEYLSNLAKQIDILCDEFMRYTFVERVCVSKEMSKEEIRKGAESIYNTLKLLRSSPVVSRMGV